MGDFERFLVDLESIEEYCQQILEEKERVSCFEDFDSNWSVQYSCSFILLQIGEKVKRQFEKLNNITDSVKWSEIVKFRDFVAHNYDNANTEILWTIIIEDIPLLHKEIGSILEQIKG